ncbi:MAG: hypothetical protein LQ340_003287 [Diploschistes diacapsis]|nr:MAG: hypothetical protein LQ340_003287 [Diploschistes diacapsis]
MAALKSVKAELRRAIQSSLSTLSTEEIATQSSKIHEVLFSLPEYQSARTLGVYLSMPNGEVSTRPVVLRSLDQGKTVFVPYLYQNSTGQQPRMLMDMVALHSREDYEALLPDSWGIPSLPKDSIPNRIRCLGDVTEANARTDEEDFNSLDLVVMPGVAFDNECQRLGHGKGFYDFFLARYHKRIGAPKGQMPFLVGLGLQQQVLGPDQEVPADSTDVPLDALIAGDGSIHRSRIP